MSGQIANFANVHVGTTQNALVLVECMAAVITKAPLTKLKMANSVP
jgi:hypothetical protein